MEEERDTINKKTKIMLVIGVSILLVLVISATYAFFAVDATNSTSSTVITGKTEKVGNATLSTLVSNLHINLSATDMAVTNAGKYYATKEDGKDYEPNKSLGYYDLAQLSLTSTGEEEDNNIYTCKTTLKITLDKEEQDSMISELQTGDVIFHTFVNGQNTDYDLSEIKNDGTLSQDIEIETVGSNTKNIRGYLEFTNKKEDDQSKLAGKNLKVTIETEGLSCNVTGKAVEADVTKMKSFIKENSTYDNQAHAEQILIINNIDTEGGTNIQDLSKDGDGSIKGWIKDKKLYIGSEGRIFIRDMSSLFYYAITVKTINLENLTFDRATNLSSFINTTPSLQSIVFPKNIDTSKVTDISSMFESLGADFRLPDLSIFDTSNVTDMSNICISYYGSGKIDLSNFDTSKVIDMGGMLATNGDLELDVSSFDTSKVTDMERMFNGRYNKLDLRSFDFKAAYNNNKLTDIFSKTFVPEIIVKDEIQKGYIQAEADKAGATIKIAGQE